MKFGLLTEAQLLTASDGQLEGLAGIWHRDILQKYGKDIEIVLGNRRDSSNPLRGGILTSAALEIREGAVRLLIWYDPLEILYEARVAEFGYSRAVIEEMTQMLSEDRDPGPEFDPVSNPEKIDYGSVAGQIGRWLLKFRGFRKLANENKAYFELESFLNLECGIPALYSLFEEAGFDRTGIEGKRLTEVFEGLRNMEEPSRRVDRVLNALRISNILEFSPESGEKKDLEKLIDEKFKRVFGTAGEINTLKSERRLSEPDGLDSFMKRLVLAYRLPGSWVSVDETTGVF